jgi:hypothetical protein
VHAPSAPPAPPPLCPRCSPTPSSISPLLRLLLSVHFVQILYCLNFCEFFFMMNEIITNKKIYKLKYSLLF